MEPLSALSLFCNIADICNHSIKVCKACREIYTSVTGLRAQDEAVLGYLEELQQVLHALRSSASKLNRGDSYKSIVAPLDRMEAQLSTALHLLNDFRANKSGNCLAAVVAAAKVAWGQAKLDKTLRELKQHRDDILFAIAQSTRVEIEEILIQTDRLSRGQQSIQSGLKCLDARLDNLKDNLSELPDMLTEARRISEEVHTELCALSILGRLGNANQRYWDVAEADSHTFHWILQDNFVYEYGWYFDYEHAAQMQNDVGERLTTWLLSGNGMFHISGKPGSGKSTLLKYLVEHPRVTRSLQEWAHPKRLALGKFFFWKPDRGQNSREALIRGLLHSIIHHDASLVHSAFPKCSKESFEQLSLKSRLHVTKQEIFEAFDNLVNSSTVSELFNFCFFIDGLDEIDEYGDATYSEVVAMLQNWVDGAEGSVKICVSSRHIPVFDNMPVDHRILLQDLTKHDVIKFVRHSLQCHPVFRAEQKVNPEVCQQLILSIFRGAEGVFLWVKLVLRSVERGLSNADSIAVLYERVECTPRGLEELFETLLGSIEDCHAQMAALLLAVATTWTRPSDDIPANLSLSMCRQFFNAIERSENRDIGTVFRADNPPESVKFTPEIIMSTRSKVHFRCKGLLEAVPDDPHSKIARNYLGGRVKVIHRSISEFLKRWVPSHINSYGIRNFHVTNTIFWLLWAEVDFFNSSISPQHLSVTDQDSLKAYIYCMAFQPIADLKAGPTLASAYSTAFELLDLMDGALLPPSSFPRPHGTGHDGRQKGFTWNTVVIDPRPGRIFCCVTLPLFIAAEIGFRAYVYWKLARMTPSPERSTYLEHCLVHALKLLCPSDSRESLRDCSHISETLILTMGADINITVPECCGTVLQWGQYDNPTPSFFDTIWLQILFHPEYTEPKYQRDAFNMVESLLALGGVPRAFVCVGTVRDWFNIPKVGGWGTCITPYTEFERLQMICGQENGIITLEKMVVHAKPSNMTAILSLIKRNLRVEDPKSTGATEFRPAERLHAAPLDKHGLGGDSMILCYDPPPPDQETD